MSDRIAKQVIVMRKDLGMRKGKMVAQGAHASLGAIFHMQDVLAGIQLDKVSSSWEEPFHSWVNGTFTKICVGVNSETELMQVFKDAMQAGLPVKLITDAGHTEFHGQPTRTCLAIGPAWSDDIDKITGQLTLL